MDLILNATARALANREVVALTLSGTKATERKQSALGQADSIGIIAISHGRGTIAKEAAQMKAEDEREGVARHVATGNFHAFAVAYAARTGESVKFGRKDDKGNVIRKASEDFRAFRSTLEHKLLQLEDKGKVYTAKGGYTSAAADLMYMISLHTRAVELMDQIAAKDEERRAKLAAERSEAIEQSVAMSDVVESAVVVEQ